MNVVVLIPAYQPSSRLVELVQEISTLPVMGILIVNDGSGASCESVFRSLAAIPKVVLLHHAVNLGKGAAMKMGINQALLSFPEAVGVVTADADGQHLPADIMMVAQELQEHPSSLVLGTRVFSGKAPLRSRFGNILTRNVLRALIGISLQDTQTGLRGLPRQLLPHLLRIKSQGYEFELDMLILAKQAKCAFRQVPIETIYIDDNRSSHFNPISDSLKIYFTLLRFLLVSILTAVIDGIVFAAFFLLGSPIYISQIAARAVALVFNYSTVRRAVFFSTARHALVFPKYVLLVVISGILSYSMISFLSSRCGFGVFPAKIIAESLIFLANFAIQRDFIFSVRDSERDSKTDWDAYYRKPAPTSVFTRRFTQNLLHRLIGRFCGETVGSLVELGGAKSCFLDEIQGKFEVREYHILDKNESGLEMLSNRPDLGTAVFTHKADVLDFHMRMNCDLVFSVGLIEHFSPPDTARAILAHFHLLRPGGIAILAFPTPTWLYRATRYVAEVLGVWRFPDERPLRREEVLRSIPDNAEVIFEMVNWPICLTQMVIVARRKLSNDALQ